ncbi:MAG: hypothetical protein IKW97_07275 [Muribaculaceae bacterium]|nr:hypothetical protein [Muribaculaceae bacterium]
MIHPLAVPDDHAVEILIAGSNHLIPIVPVCICTFHAITLTWRLEFYPEPTLLVIAHHLQSLHGILYSKHHFECCIIDNNTVQMVFMG